MQLPIDFVLAGVVQRFTEEGETSAIIKTPVSGPVAVHALGVAGDEQADLTVHGGPDKAIHHYPRDHYGWWQDALGPLPVLADAGAFGENISTRGLTEDEACLGDRFRLGTALVEIAQGRQPCWKQAHRLRDKTVVATMVKSGKSGWYYRVIENGVVAAGDMLTLVERPLPDWPIARVAGLLIRGDGKHDPAALRALAGFAVLADNWRARAHRAAAR